MPHVFVRGATLTLVVGLCSSAGTFAQTIATHRLPAALAMEAASMAVSTCAKQGHAVSATVMDADAVAIAVLRGDGAPVHTVEASWQKAYTAASFAPIFGQDSGSGVAAVIARANAAQPPGSLPFQTPEHMIVRAGGLTIRLKGEVLGAIGVGGAPGAELDEACARAGLDAIRDRIR